jgi:outer membrane protein assembly factor BamB
MRPIVSCRHVASRMPASIAGMLSMAALIACGGCHDVLAGSESSDDPLLWRSDHGGWASWHGQPAIRARTLFTMRGDAVIALDGADGSLLWTRSIDTAFYGAANLVVHDRMLYVSGSRSTYAIDVVTGRIVWEVAPDDSSSAGSENLADERALYVGTRDAATVHALAHPDGRTLWSARLGAGWPYLGAVQGISRSGDTLYATVTRALDGRWVRSRAVVVALDRTNGRELWRHESIGDGTYDAAATISGELLLLSDVDGSAFVALDRRDGRQLWKTPTIAPYMGPRARPIVEGDVVYAAAQDGHVYAMRRSDGHVLWRVDTGASNTHLARCGTTLLAQAQGVAEVEMATGRLRRVFLDDPDDFTTTGFVVDGRRAYVGGTLAVYAFRCG